MTDIARDSLDPGRGIDGGPHVQSDSGRLWRTWLCVLLSLTLALIALLYSAVVLIDPFSTGRFAVTQRLDLATQNTLLGRAGLVRDPQFNGAIVGGSTALVLDPVNIARGTSWRIALLAMLAVSPASQLTVARAFERHHRGSPTLEIFAFDSLWCRVARADLEEPFWAPFPSWLYEGSDPEYLSRILSWEAIYAATRRVGIWLGYSDQVVRFDGYAPWFPNNRVKLAPYERPTAGPPPEAPFPAIDALAAHIAALAAESVVIFVIEPTYISMLPADGSIAAARLQACKERVRNIAVTRPNSAFVDLMTDNAIARTPEYFADRIHYTDDAARLVEAAIAQAMKDGGLSRP